MGASTEYVTLLASLPALGPILAAKNAPINGSRLRDRLKMLRPEHQQEIEAAAALLAWSRLRLDHTDADLVGRARRVIPALRSPFLAKLTIERLELRTVMAALRRRHSGQDAPPVGELWGYGRFVTKIAARWREPGFGLERSFPWVVAAREKLERGDTAGLERIALEAAWRQAARMQEGHQFDFEAVALYVIRWNILDRWTRYDAEAAAARFSDLVDAALKAAPAYSGASTVTAGAHT